jgi:RNA polymerase sigma-70 factor (ECF subfamily)
MTVEDYYRALAPKLTNWLVATGSSYHDACDLVQRTFLKLWEMRDDLRDDDSAVSGLVFTIAKNLRKNAWRDGARLTYVEEIHEDAAGAIQPPEESPSDAAYIRSRIEQALAQLPPLLREAYTLFQIGELSIREIAHETGVSENLVKVRIFRAKQKLQPLLADLRAY